MKTKNKKTVLKIATIAALAAAFLALDASAQEPLKVPKAFDDNAPTAGQADKPLQVPQMFQSDEAQPSRLSGDWPEKVRKINITATDKPIADILQDISRQLGYGLVLKASEETVAKKITLRLIRKPADDVLEIVLESGNLSALLKDDVLFVGPATPASPAAPAGPAAPTAQAAVAQPAAPSEPPFPAVSPVPQIPDISVMAKISDDDDDNNDDKTIEIRHRVATSHKRNRVQVGKSVHIKADEEVDDAVSVGGGLTIEGKVNGDAVAVGGPLTVKSGATVNGDTVAIGGPLEIEDGAVVYGERVGVGIPIPIGSILSDLEDGDLDAGVPFAVSGLAGTFAAFSFLGFLLKFVLLFVLALVVVLLAPKRVERIRGYLVENTGKSILAGAVMLLSFVPLIILLAVTIIGLPLIPVAMLALLILVVIGLAALLTWIGYKIPLFQSKKNQLIALAIGVVLVMVLSIIPVIGPLALFLASFVAAGAALLSRVGSESKDSVIPPPASPSEPAAPAASE